MKRFFKHLFTTRRSIYKYFPKDSLKRIEAVISESEKKHSAELCFAVEASLRPEIIYRGVSPRERALEVFSNLRVWDTEENSGVLIYLLLADRRIEIVADRGITKKVGQGKWEEICRQMESHFRKGGYLEGVFYGIDEISKLMVRHFPASPDNKNEISDKPVIL